MSFSQGSLLPVWDSSIKHNGFSFFPFFAVCACVYSHSCAPFHRPILSISVLRPTFPVPVVGVSGARTRGFNYEEFSQTFFFFFPFPWEQCSQNVLVVSLRYWIIKLGQKNKTKKKLPEPAALYLKKIFQSWKGASCEVERGGRNTGSGQVTDARPSE